MAFSDLTKTFSKEAASANCSFWSFYFLLVLRYQRAVNFRRIHLFFNRSCFRIGCLPGKNFLKLASGSGDAIIIWKIVIIKSFVPIIIYELRNAVFLTLRLLLIAGFLYCRIQLLKLPFLHYNRMAFFPRFAGNKTNFPLSFKV